MRGLHIMLFGSFVSLLASCATKETVPQVSVKPNGSGIEVASIKSMGPSSWLGRSRGPDGEINKPDTPTQTALSIERIQDLQNKEPRFFIPASGRLRVVSVENFSTYPDPEDLVGLQRYLGMAKGAAPDSPPEIPWMNAARVFKAKLRVVEYPWGKAVLYLTSYVQGRTGGPVNNDMLTLVCQGLTKDGRYAVNGKFEIRHPKLPKSLWDERQEGLAVFSIDDDCEEAERWLSAQLDDVFTPSFRQYEEFLSSLVIEPGPYWRKSPFESY